MTAALEGAEWSAARPGRTLPPRKTRYPFYRRLGGPQGRSVRAENLVPPPGFDPGKEVKIQSLCIEIQRMWNLKCTIIPVITGATGIVTRSVRKNLEAVPGKHSIDSLQKTAKLGTSHIIRKVLQCEA